MREFLPVICSSGLFSGVEAAETIEMMHCLSARKAEFQRGEYILHEGDKTDCLGLLVAGQALVVHEDYWGNRNLMASIGRGQCFGESFACAPEVPLDVSVVAESACVVIFLNAGQILRTCPENCIHHNRMIRNLLSILAHKNLSFSERVTHLGQRTTRAKLLSYLSAESQRQGSPEFEISLSRQQMADYLLVERSGLSQELSKMQTEGLITFHKNHFRLN